jgi:hypothetical protein
VLDTSPNLFKTLNTVIKEMGSLLTGVEYTC